MSILALRHRINTLLLYSVILDKKEPSFRSRKETHL